MTTSRRIVTRRSALAGLAGLGIVLAEGLRLREQSTGRPASAAPAPPSPPKAPVRIPAAPAPERTVRARVRHIAARPQPGELDSALLTVPDSDKTVYLSFDDGPHPTFTPLVLQALRRYGVRATFCVIGENAAANPHLLRAALDDGHILANHSWDHPQLTTLDETAVREQLARTSDIIDRSTGTIPYWCRAPYGDWNSSALATCADLGMVPLGWSVDTVDWEQPGLFNIARSVYWDTTPGAIVLCHDGGGERPETVDAINLYVPALIEDGWSFGLL